MKNRRINDTNGPSSASQRAKHKEIGNYMLSKTMGEGTFGEVKLAIHKPTLERVAAKVMEKNRIKTIADVKRVSREIKILKRVRHPNVIALYEVLDTPSTIYFMMEHCDGGELFDYIVRHQRLQEGQACFFFRQLVDGIEYLHDHDVTHRDLKPENLLLQSASDGWQLKIIDFGLSNTHEGGKLLRTACGSPCYAAPEMIAGKSYLGPAADIWSCGVVLFTLVAGFLPFEDPNTSALYKKIMSGSYEIPRWLSDDAVHLLSRILNTDPDKRSTVQEIRLHAWCAAAHSGPASLQTVANPLVPSRRSDVDDNLLARALTLSNGDEVWNGDQEGAEGTKGGVAIPSPAALSAAVEGLLSGRHDRVGTTYHLLLKKKLRHDGSVDVANSGAGTGRDTVVRLEDLGRARQSSNPVAGGTLLTTVPRASENREGGVNTGARASGSEKRVSANPAATGIRRAYASNLSTTTSSSSRSGGHHLVASRRKSTAPAPAPKEGAPLKSAAEKVASTAATRKGSLTRRVGTGGVRPDPLGTRPRSASMPRHAPSSAIAASSTATAPIPTARPSIEEVGQEAIDAGNKVTLAAAGGTDGLGLRMRQRPVPLLSFCRIARTDRNRGGCGDSSSKERLANSAVLVSQTARFGRCGVNNQADPNTLAGRRTGGHSRARGGSGRTTGNGGGGAGFRVTPAVVAAGSADQPLTARAPLRPSAPTPRLSVDFSLTCPSGAPTVVGGVTRTGATPCPRSTRAASGARRLSVGAPLAVETSLGTSSTTATTVSTTKALAGGGVGTAGSAAPPPPRLVAASRHQQPSLRVRLSSVSTKLPQQRRRPELNGERRAERGVGIEPAEAVTARKTSGEASSCGASSTTAEAAALYSSSRGAVAGRVSSGGHSTASSISAGVRGQHASSLKAWERGTPVAFHPVKLAGAAALPLAKAAPVGGR